MPTAGPASPVGRPLGALAAALRSAGASAAFLSGCTTAGYSASRIEMPAAVVLRSAEGQEWRPRAWGPGLLERKGWTCPAPQAGGTGSAYHFLSPKTCFALAFEVTIEPETRLDLVLGGVARGRRAINPVTLRI